SATFTLTGTLPAGAIGALTNAATITAPFGVTDANPGNNLAVSNDAAAPKADLAITKSGTPNPYVPGAPLTYTVTATHLCPSDVIDASARVQDLLPGLTAGFSWTCVPSSGATCGSSSGTGSVDALITLQVGATVTFTITGTAPSGKVVPISNTASITAPLGVT